MFGFLFTHVGISLTYSIQYDELLLLVLLLLLQRLSSNFILDVGLLDVCGSVHENTRGDRHAHQLLEQ